MKNVKGHRIRFFKISPVKKEVGCEGGWGQKKFNKRSLRVVKMWIERTFDLDLTIYVKQSHITCKLDPNKLVLSCQKVNLENLSTKGPSTNC